MLLRTLALLAAASVAQSAEQVDRTQLRDVSTGLIALCRPTILDEWQIVGEPQRLSEQEASKLGRLIASDDAWYERQPDGRKSGARVFSCNEHGDFKVVLFDPKANVFATARICAACRGVELRINAEPVKLPMVREAAWAELTHFFDKRFPNWRVVSEENKRRWKDETRKLQP